MMQKLAIPILVLIVAASASGQSLKETVDWMKSSLVAGSDQKLIPPFDDPCRLFVSDTVTYRDRSYDLEWQFHLGKMDPKRITIDSDNKKKTIVYIHPTNDAAVVWSSASHWKEDAKVPKLLQYVTTTSFGFSFVKIMEGNEDRPKRFATALEHAITLCGGKPSTF